MIIGAVAVTETIQLVLGPSVMVTASGVILNGILSRLASINDRVRTLSLLRFDLLREMRQPDVLLDARLREIDRQFPELLQRLRMERDAAIYMYLAIALFLGSMIVLAVAALSAVAWIGTLVLIMFLGGIVTLASSVLLVIREIRFSLTAIEFEAQAILHLRPDASATKTPSVKKPLPSRRRG
jgi:hypothetical protein